MAVTMGQERLTYLALVAIERFHCSQLDASKVVTIISMKLTQLGLRHSQNLKSNIL